MYSQNKSDALRFRRKIQKKYIKIEKQNIKKEKSEKNFQPENFCLSVFYFISYVWFLELIYDNRLFWATLMFC